jgi:Domain of Unknown Function (DUF1080)
MKNALGLVVAASALLAAEPGDKSLFDGKTLQGWSNPDMSYWSVEEGAITGRSTAAHPARRNYYLIWQGGDVADFELTLRFRIQGDASANAGIQFRTSFNADATHSTGYQADIDRAGKYLGALYDEGEGRRQLFAPRGSKVEADSNGRRKASQFASPDELMRGVNLDGWNEYRIVARGHHLSGYINGRLMFQATDNDPKLFLRSGRLALQLHAGPPMQVQYKDIILRRFEDR